MRPITRCFIVLMIVTIGPTGRVGHAVPSGIDLRIRGPRDRDLRDIVIHAAGSVEFRLPVGWKLSEAAVGREIRLLVTPGKFPSSTVSLSEGAWISHHRRSTSDAVSRDLRTTLAARLRFTRAGDRLEIGPIDEISVAGVKALRQAFSAALDRNGKTTHIRGYHILAITGAGLLEIQFVAPASRYTQPAEGMEQLLQSLVLAAPARRKETIENASVDARAILGPWKSVRARVFIHGNGQMVMQFDRQGVYPVEGDGSLNYEKKVSRLVGQYKSRGDLLLVTWQDGSRTNYRWRLDDGELLLTDHTGRVSKLRSLFE